MKLSSKRTFKIGAVETAIVKAVKLTDGEIAGIGIDSWSVDFGLVGAKGKLIENSYHYRDSRTNGIMEKACLRQEDVGG